ncbi:MAG: hypothetical protein V1820_04690 [archaeon]
MGLKKKGQSSVELLVVFAIGISALLAFFALSQQKIAETRTQLVLSEAKETVELLSRAADEVYSEGVNSTRKLYVTIPEGVNLSRSSISGNALILSIQVPGGVTDVSARTGEPVFGTWPDLPGAYHLTVTSYEGSVGIGTSVIQVSPTAIYSEMTAFSSEEKNVTLTNFGQDPIPITGTLYWTEDAEEVTVENLTAISFTLSSGESRNITLGINSSFSALGSYSGTIDFSGGGEEYSLPITVHVSGAYGSEGTSNVSYIAVETFKESGCATEKLIFEGPENTTLSGFGWPAGVSLDFQIYNSTGSSLYSSAPTTNSTGGFSVVWSPAGRSAGEYSANASDPISANSARGVFFTVESC